MTLESSEIKSKYMYNGTQFLMNLMENPAVSFNVSWLLFVQQLKTDFCVSEIRTIHSSVETSIAIDV